MMPTGPCPAEVMIVGEAPGAEEERLGRPFVGASGIELDKMLHEAGILRSECFVTNVCRTRPANNDIEQFWIRRKQQPKFGQWTQIDGTWCTKEVVFGLEKLHQEIALCQPKVIIAFGNLSLWALTGKLGIMDWRGSSLRYSRKTDISVIPTYHPAAILRVWSWRPYVICDLKRVTTLRIKGVAEPRNAFIIAPRFNQATECLNALLTRLEAGVTHLSCDIETRNGHIACIGIGWSRTEAICIPLMESNAANKSYWAEHEEFHILWMLYQILTHPNVRVSGQNFVYDTQYFQRHLHFVPHMAMDTLLMQHICWPGTDKDLATLSSLYCEHHLYWKDDGKEWRSTMDERNLWAYNCVDCVRTWEIAEALSNLVVQLGLTEPCVFLHRMWWRSLETMNLGVRMALDDKTALSKELAVEIDARQKWLEEVVGHKLNPRSPKQMAAFFYADLSLPVQRGPKGQPTCNSEALWKLARKEPVVKPVVKKIEEIRSLGVFRSTFVEGQLDVDLRMRCSYNVAGTESYRLSSSENAFGTGMNLQNVPPGGSMDEEDPDALVLPNVRKLFIPDPGFEMFDMDLASADLCIVAWDSGDPELKALLKAGISVYLELAKEYYHDSRVTKQDTRYTKFKSLCHGTNYLGTARGLAQRLGLTVAQVDAVQKWYFHRFNRLPKWQERLCNNLQTQRQVRNCFGFRRFYFDRIDGTLYNQAIAWIPQSTIGLLINKIWDRVRTEEPVVQILLQTHDSLTGQYPITQAEYFRARLKELSKIPLPYDDPLTIGTGFKYSTESWGHCK